MTAGSRSGPPETVVLLHGFGMGRWAMWPIARALRAEGRRVLNLDYPSKRIPLETLARVWLPERLRRQGVGRGSPLHFVTHSMGGIVLRMFVREHPGFPIGRVVMLAPPNAGSQVVDHLRTFAPLRAFLGRNGLRLGTGPDSVPLALGPWPQGAGRLGIIAGDRSLNPLFGKWLGGPNDGKVAVASTRLEGMGDFRILPHTHTWLQWCGDTAKEVRAFLEAGKFS